MKNFEIFFIIRFEIFFITNFQNQNFRIFFEFFWRFFSSIFFLKLKKKLSTVDAEKSYLSIGEVFRVIPALLRGFSSNLKFQISAQSVGNEVSSPFKVRKPDLGSFFFSQNLSSKKVVRGGGNFL